MLLAMQNKLAFTLIELSIVIVIIGLIVGGVLVGQDLIQAAKLRAVAGEYQQFQTALTTFKLKYSAIPGDMKNATTFWGADANCDTSATYLNPKTSEATCNGDGDKIIDIIASGTGNNEVFNFWHHLGNAGLIDGTYTGVPSQGAFNHLGSTPGSNVPKSVINGAGWQIGYAGAVTVSSAYYIEGTYNNFLTLGSPSASNNYIDTAAISPQDAWKIDAKLDDGIAGSGKIVSSEIRNFCYRNADGSYANFSTSVARADLIYDYDREDVQCLLHFREFVY